LVLLLFYFGSAVALTAIAQIFDPETKFMDFPPFWAGSFAIALIIGSYATETFRGAFLGIDPGQIEAGRALGLSSLQTFIYVRIPAMWRLALPPFGNHMLSLIKDTALISIIGMQETFFVAKQAIGTTGKPFTMYILVGVIYLRELTRMLVEQEILQSLIIAEDLMNNRAPALNEDDNLDVAMQMFSGGIGDQVAVVEAENSRKLVGCIHKNDVLQAYNREVMLRDLAGSVSTTTTGASTTPSALGRFGSSFRALDIGTLAIVWTLNIGTLAGRRRRTEFF